ncbi:hypothetical protein GCM10011273_34440 [Asticcacaulis endophyticus]|uniref:Uncharacterized protein n=1 Tax=Asticcacaulis endophyticus TaxID=1395890 RepID=A0A918QES3_9CAUL|nr:hypothetical protein GCM10011273_34440 [Asticcacaulis endophyticus]
MRAYEGQVAEMPSIEAVQWLMPLRHSKHLDKVSAWPAINIISYIPVAFEGEILPAHKVKMSITRIFVGLFKQ